jgi:hypothetical protein
MSLRISRNFLAGVLLAVLLAASALAAGNVSSRYALILNDPPAAARFSSRASLATADAQSYRLQLARTQAALRRDLAGRNIRVTSSVKTLLNAVFVVA